MSNALVWFYNDLRLADNPALVNAIESGKPVIPIFIWDENDSDLHTGGAAKWWLHQSLDRLSNRIEELGSKLIFRSGTPKTIIQEMVDDYDVSSVYLNRRFEPHIIERDNDILEGIEHEISNGNLLFDPEDIMTKQEKRYTVFTPFWKNCKMQTEPHEPLAVPTEIPAPSKFPDSLELDEMKLLPNIKWYTTFEKKWRPGEEEANRILIHFLKSEARKYGKQRNIPGIRGTSRLSPYLRFGEISPNTIWHESKPYDNPGTEHFVREVGWREFGYHLMANFPFLANRALRENFEDFPWRDSEEDYTAWTKGMTGYPIVDAGMRELYATGWMHNRVRMIVASFLVKHLLIDWKKGEKIGHGTYGDVFMALNQVTGELFCVKQIRVQPGVVGGEKEAYARIKALEREISVMKNLEHPHIVRYLGTESKDAEGTSAGVILKSSKMGRGAKHRGRKVKVKQVT